MAVDVTKAGEELSGLRKVLQDLLAPEIGSIKSALTAIHEGQQSLKQDMQAGQQSLKQDMQGLRQEMQLLRQETKEDNQQLREELLRTIHLSANELKALIKAGEAERRLADSERRNAELERRLAERSTSAPS